MSLISRLSARLQNHPKRVIFPEGADPRVIQAARQFATSPAPPPEFRSAAAYPEPRALPAVAVVAPSHWRRVRDACVIAVARSLDGNAVSHQCNSPVSGAISL